MTKKYYSTRTGKHVAGKPDLEMVCRMVWNVYEGCIAEGFFKETIGYYRKDDGRFIPGTVGPDLDAAAFQRLHKSGLFPIRDRHPSYSEDDLFDVIELLHDWVSEWFQWESGPWRFRQRINAILADYRDGYELSERGEVLSLAGGELRSLLEEEVPQYDPENVESRVRTAVHRYRYHTASIDDKREAVRQLADVLEFLRKKLEGILPSKEENEIFIIANKFGIRHHRPDQKTQYDKEIWLDWIFYCYLNSIHVSVNLLKRAQEISQ